MEASGVRRLVGQTVADLSSRRQVCCCFATDEASIVPLLFPGDDAAAHTPPLWFHRVGKASAPLWFHRNGRSSLSQEYLELIKEYLQQHNNERY